MQADEGVPAPPADLLAQSGSDGAKRQVAVSGLQPQAQQGEQQQYVGVPPPSSQAPAPTFLQKARAPFMGLTVLATAAIASWQSKRLYARRQEALLEEFASTMVFYFGDEREMEAAIRTTRQQLGPGKYTGKMYTAFVKDMATNVPIGVKAVQNLKSATALFRLSDAAAAELLEAAAKDLDRQPSVLGAPARKIPEARASRGFGAIQRLRVVYAYALRVTLTLGAVRCSQASSSLSRSARFLCRHRWPSCARVFRTGRSTLS